MLFEIIPTPCLVVDPEYASVRVMSERPCVDVLGQRTNEKLGENFEAFALLTRVAQMPEVRSASKDATSALVLFVDVFVNLSNGFISRNRWSVKLVKESATPKRFPVTVQCIVRIMANESK